MLFSPDTRGRLDHGRPAPFALRKQIIVQIIIYNRRKQLHHKNTPSKQFLVQSRVIEDFRSVYCCYLFTFRHWSNWCQVRCEPYVQMYRDARAVHNCVPKRILSPLLNTQSQLWWDRYHFVCTLAYTWLEQRVSKVEPIQSVKRREGRHVQLQLQLFTDLFKLGPISKVCKLVWSSRLISFQFSAKTDPTFLCTKLTHLANHNDFH